MSKAYPFIALSFILSIIFFALSVFKSAVNSISEVAARKVAEKRGEKYHFFAEKLYANPSEMRIVLQLSRQASLIGAMFAILVAFLRMEVTYPVTSALLVSIIVLAMFVEQLAARLIVAIHPEKAFSLSLPLLPFLYFLFYPLMYPIYSVLSAARKKLGPVIDKEDDESVEENIRAFINVGERDEILEKEEGMLVKSIVDFGDTLAREVMTPRTDMITIEIHEGIDSLKKLVIREKHSRIPVFRDTIDNIVGIIYARDLLEAHDAMREGSSITDLVQPAYFVPETKKVSELLKEMQDEKMQIAMVVDEYGGTAGLITIEDLLEEIVGEIHDIHERGEPDIIKDSDGVYIAKGVCNIEEIENLFNSELKQDDFDTVGGFVFAKLGRVPSEGESFEFKDLKFEVLRADNRRIGKVRIRKIPS